MRRHLTAGREGQARQMTNPPIYSIRMFTSWDLLSSGVKGVTFSRRNRFVLHFIHPPLSSRSCHTDHPVADVVLPVKANLVVSQLLRTLMVTSRQASRAILV
jgi:hypothetical protein